MDEGVARIDLQCLLLASIEAAKIEENMFITNWEDS